MLWCLSKQIRVKVIQARQLQGANIQPVTRVSVSNQMRQTRVKKSTNTPHWNESFFFNFHASPAELFEELIEFQVFNSRRLRSDALIGSFKVSLHLIFKIVFMLMVHIFASVHIALFNNLSLQVTAP